MDDDGRAVTRSWHPWARFWTVVMVGALVGSAFALISSGFASGSQPNPTPSAVGPRHELTVGGVSVVVQTTNILQYTLADEVLFTGHIYSYLIGYDQDFKMEPDLALRWVRTSSSHTTYEIELARSAYFIDPRTCTKDAIGHINACDLNRPVTADDVAFTLMYVKANRNSTSYFASVTEHIASAVVLSTYRVRVTWDGPYTPALDDLAIIPILPQYIWATLPVTDAVPLPIGSGPMMARPDAVSCPCPGATGAIPPPPIILDRNPHWHGKEVVGRQVFPDTARFVNYETQGALALDLALGKLDLVLGPDAPTYLGYLARQPGILRQTYTSGLEYQQAINVLEPWARDYFASISSRPIERGHTNLGLLHQEVRTAIHMVTNRQKMIDNAWLGLATPADPLLMPANPYYYDYPDYVGPTFEFGQEEFPDGPEAPGMAREILTNAGWRFVCATGALQTGVESPLCRSSTGELGGQMVERLEFSYSTFNTEPWWEVAARGVIEDAAKAGIKINLDLVNPSQMYQLWVKLDYEIWLWNWIFTPVSLPQTYSLLIQTCKGIVTLDNDNGMCLRDPVTGRWTLDDLTNQTLIEDDPVRLKQLTDQGHKMIYDFAAYNMPFWLDAPYAMNQVRWTNWGVWNDVKGLPPDLGVTTMLVQNVWPVDQKPPQFTLANVEGAAGTSVPFSVAAIDPEGASLAYRWDFDGSSEPGTGPAVNSDRIYDNDEQSTAQSPTYTYPSSTQTRVYDVTLRVSEVGGDFFTVKRAKATISPPAVGSPRVSAISFGPSDPTTYAGDLVTFAAVATDPAGIPLVAYNWNFGDGSTQTTTGPATTHAYTSLGPKTVSLTVRNANGVTSSPQTTALIVSENVAPVVAPLEDRTVVENLEDTFVAFASDANSRDVLS